MPERQDLPRAAKDDLLVGNQARQTHAVDVNPALDAAQEEEPVGVGLALGVELEVVAGRHAERDDGAALDAARHDELDAAGHRPGERDQDERDRRALAPGVRRHPRRRHIAGLNRWIRA